MASDVRVQATPATRIYATSFQIRQPGRSAADTLSDAALTTLRWAGDENQSWIDGRQLTPKGEVVAETAAGSGLDVRHMNLSHPDHAQPGVHWRTSLDLVRIANRVEIYCQLTRRDPSGDPNLPGSVITIPRVVRDLAAMGGFEGRQAIGDRPIALAGDSSVEDFVEGVLLDSDRRRPVVLFSPTQDGNYVPTRGAIDQLARDTIGVAHVYYLSEPSDTFRLSDRVGKMMSVWNGALRTYWPGFSLTGSPFDHPILFQDRIGPWVVEWLRRQMITRAAGTWAVPAEVRDLLVRRRQEVERDELKARLQAAQSDLAMLELYREETERLNVERDLLAELLASSEAEATVYEKEIDRQADEIRQLRYRIRVGLSSPTESEDEITWPEPSTLVEAILKAAEAYPDTLVITDRALASCEQMNPADNAPARLWRIFQSMDDVCRRWRTDTLKMSIAMALQQLGFKMSLVSEVTKGRHPNAYYFTYKGRRVSVGPHVQISRGERVYWYQDDDDRQFVVNHVGEHLPDSTT